MNEESEVLLTTELPLPLFIRGKVRDTYDLGNYILIVVTDRISAFDVILPAESRIKGMCLIKFLPFGLIKQKN